MNSDWMMPDDIFLWLETNVKEGATVLEFGSGHGSIRLAKQYNLISIEHDKEWVGVSDSTYIHVEIEENPISKENNQQGWYVLSPIIEAIQGNKIDVFLVDGPPGDIGRHGILSLIGILPTDAIFIIDDVHRDAEFDLFMKIIQWHGGQSTIHASTYDSGKERKWAVIEPAILEGSR